VKKSIESYFPFEQIDEIAEIESYRKEINRPMYHIHKWWAKRLGSVFRSIVSGSLSEGKWERFHEFQDYRGKVVLDPFMGSGTTLGEAAKIGAKAIGCDVNPVSTFLVSQALQQVDLNKLETEFCNIERDVKDEIQSFYMTDIDSSDHLVNALYYFWVKVVETPDGNTIPLFSNYIFSKNAYPKKKPEAQILCPGCGAVFVGRYDSTHETCPDCRLEYNPQIGNVKGAKVFSEDGAEYKIKELVKASGSAPGHRLYAVMAINIQGVKIYKKPSKFDFDLLEKASLKYAELKDDLPLPDMEVRPGHNTNQARGYNYNFWKDFFSERQLLCLGILLERIMKIEDPVVRDHFVCLFSGSLEFNNLFCSFKGEGTGAVRHMFSNHILKPERTPLENTVWGVEGKSSGTFSSLFKSRLLKAKTYLSDPFEIYVDRSSGKKVSKKIVCSNPINVSMEKTWDGFVGGDNKALVLNGDSSNLPIPDEVVDAVVTDPPYFDFVHYSELSDFFYAWLKKALVESYDYFDREDSSHANEVQDKENEVFSRKIQSVFSECNRVLKSDGVMCFSYHHSTVDGWIAIYNAVVKAGFVISAAHPVKAEMSVATPKSGSKSPINIDAILVCKKASIVQHRVSPEAEITERIHQYFSRFEDIGRNLSEGDKFVVACSQAVSVASEQKMTAGDAHGLLIWASTTYSDLR